MKRVVTTLVAGALLSTLLAVPAAGNQYCTKGDVQGLVNALELSPELLGDAFGRCQFRIFDENDDPNDPFGNPDNPEIPHVFTDKDYILAGIALFEGYEFFDRPEYDRNAAIDLLNMVADRFFFGTADTLDGDLEEMALTQTNYRDFVVEAYGHIVATHKYHIFSPGSLAPGEYKFRHEQTFPGFPDFVARNAVVILDA